MIIFQTALSNLILYKSFGAEIQSVGYEIFIL